MSKGTAMDLGSGFGGYFTRTGSLALLVLVSFMLFSPESVDMTEYEINELMPWPLVWFGLGIFGTLVKPDGKNIITRLLCNLGGVAGMVIVFNVLSQLV